MHTQKAKYIFGMFLFFSAFVLVVYGTKENKSLLSENKRKLIDYNYDFWNMATPLEKYINLVNGHVTFHSCIIDAFNEFSPLYGYAENIAMVEVSLLETEQEMGNNNWEDDIRLDDDYSVESLLAEQNQKEVTLDNLNYDIEHVVFTDFTNTMIEEKYNREGTMLLPVNSTSVRLDADFLPKKNKVLEYDINKMKNKDYLIQNFYTVDSGTTAPTDMLDIESLLNQNMKIDKTVEGPQILIYHTHSREGYADSIAENEDTTIVGMGELLKNILEEKYGYQVLHHTDRYDTVRHDYAYSYALPEISKLIEEYPSIQVVIDLHRDEVAADKKLVVNQDGKETAQFMFFNGVSFINGKGRLDSLQNPNLQSNLAFSFQMQKMAGEYYPGLTRRIYLKGYRYNMHLKDKYLLVELGAQTNTVEEARNACYPLADVLDKVIGDN